MNLIFTEVRYTKTGTRRRYYSADGRRLKEETFEAGMTNPRYRTTDVAETGDESRTVITYIRTPRAQA